MGAADQFSRPQHVGQGAAEGDKQTSGLLNHSSRHNRGERWLAPANPITRSSSPFSNSRS